VKSRKYVILLLVILVLLVASTLIQPKETSSPEEVLTFSTTQTWDSELYGLIGNESVILPDALESITLPEPSSNNSDTTKRELEELHVMISERTQEKVAQITQEIELETVRVGPYIFAEVTHADQRPFTRHLLLSILEEYDPLIMYFKNHFDRVRPSILDPSLSVAIEIPGHPAYPSGHSSQAHLLAHIMSDVDPDNADEYWGVAKEVARNREVAGVHYKSDSEAGRLLAEQYYSLLKETAWYKTMLGNAKTEW
jgi:acid phosphatase (class A)